MDLVLLMVKRNPAKIHQLIQLVVDRLSRYFTSGFIAPSKRWFSRWISEQSTVVPSFLAGINAHIDDFPLPNMAHRVCV